MEKKSQSNPFIPTSKMEWEDLGKGVHRKILGYDNQIMMVMVKFDEGAIGALHQHFHSQTTYCESGKFEFTVNNETKIIEAGDGVYIAPNLLHSAVCIHKGILIDVFSPVREDFLSETSISYFNK